MTVLLFAVAVRENGTYRKRQRAMPMAMRDGEADGQGEGQTMSE